MMFTPIWGTMTFNYMSIVLGLALAYFLAKYFYFKKKPKEPLKEGLLLGLVVAAVSAAIEIPLMVYGYAALIGWAWFAQWTTIAGYALTVVACVLAAMSKEK
jgi:putative flippase GtrA